MKFLHIADLHIGKSVSGVSMLEEQRNIFCQIIECIKAEHPAALVISGDVYDRAVPSVEAVRLFDDFLTELSQEDIAVLIIAGNHDSPERLNYASRLLASKRLYFCGAFRGELNKITLVDEYGDVNFWLLPFIKPQSFKDAIESAAVDYAERNVLLAHQFFTKHGIKSIRSESEINSAGGLDAVDAGLIEKFDYAALGHLHGAQQVGAAHIRYAGSPIKYSFSEWRQKKSVTLVELNKKNNLTVKEFSIKPIHDMREIKGELQKLISDEVSLLADKEDYLRVILTDEEEITDPMAKLRAVYPNIMSLDFENSRTKTDVSTVGTDALSVESLSPYELFAEFFLDTQGTVMSCEQAEIVRELLADKV